MSWLNLFKVTPVSVFAKKDCGARITVWSRALWRLAPDFGMTNRNMTLQTISLAGHFSVVDETYYIDPAIEAKAPKVKTA